jgi:TfoX/Sxy family transcriptional regulator of competence genes
MAYDEALADRVRDLLADRGELREQKMFGGLCWMLNGNMACGVLNEDLIVRGTRTQVDAGAGYALSLPPK